MAIIDGLLNSKCVRFKIRVICCRPCKSRIWCLSPTKKCSELAVTPVCTIRKIRDRYKFNLYNYKVNRH